MASKSYLTSTTLIESIKRRGMIPTAQQTLTDDDLLSIANEELKYGIVSTLISTHEEYLIYKQVTPIEANNAEYIIPERALGSKIRDLMIVDQNNNLFDIPRISPENREVYSPQGGSIPRNIFFYVQNNSVILTPVPTTDDYSLVFLYYQRPSELVPASGVGICESITYSNKTITEANAVSAEITDGVATIYFDAAVTGLFSSSAQLSFSGITDPSLTGLNATTANPYYEVSSFPSASSVNFTVTDIADVANTALTPNPSLDLYQYYTILQLDNMPEDFDSGVLIDFNQTGGGHRIYSQDYALPTNSVDVVSKTLTIPTEDVPTDFTIGDHVAPAGNCFVPQVPDEMHPILAQRVVVKALEAIGDSEGMQIAQAKLSEMQTSIMNIIDDRTEGNPIKVFNKTSTLRAGKFRRGYGYGVY